MAADGFWSNPSGANPARSLIDLNSVGDVQAGPMGQLPGTTAGAIPSAYSVSAQAVYPWTLDFTAADRLAEYNDFVATKLAEFPSWHSSYQARYLATAGFVSVPAGSRTAPTARPDAFYLLGADGRTVNNIMGLTISDYQRMPQADRAALENEAVFRTYVAPSLGLVLPSASGVQTRINSVLTTINGSTLPAADKGVFTEQLRILTDRLNAATRVVATTMLEHVGEISGRFARVLAFGSVRGETRLDLSFEGTDGDRRRAFLQTDVQGYAISSDSNATVNQGYSNMMRAERELLTAQLRREAMSRNTTIYDPKQDVANLIYNLQLLYQNESKALADSGTEEMSQLHRLLSDYAIMQRLVNETLKVYNPKETDEKRRFMNIGARADGSVENAQSRDAQDAQVRYDWADGFSVTRGTNNVGAYSDTPRFHWFQLQGTYPDHRIGDGIVYDTSPDGLFDFNNDGSFLGDAQDYYGDRNVYVRSGGLTAVEMRIVGMFSKDVWGSGAKSQDHPIESLYTVTRPKSLLTDESASGYSSLRLERRDYWDKWSTQLSDAVTILNQKNQLKQNEIESNTKEANRHFDLGNNALKKMNEMLMSIGRM